MLRDYVYTPLIAVGRTRNPKLIIYRNTLITMLVCGLWHGATWLFVLWGGFHGLVMVFEHWRGRKGWYASLPRAVRVAATFVLLLFSWVLFRSETLAGAGRFYAAMLGLSAATPQPHLLAAVLYSPSALVVMVVCAVASFVRWQAWEWTGKITPLKAAALIGLFAVALLEMTAQSAHPFLYSRF